MKLNYINRTLKSITRRKGKTTLIFLIVFILGTVIAGAIAVNQSTSNIEQTIKNSMGAVATINVDYNNIEKADWKNIKALSKETIQKVGESPHVKVYDYNLKIGL